MRARLNDERGATVIELLVAATIGMIVLAAVGVMVASSERTGQRIRTRVDATQQARSGHEQVTQQLRSMVCVPVPNTAGGTSTVLPPIIEATPTSITFHADLDANTIDDAQQRRLSVLTAADGQQSIVEDRWAGLTPPVAASAPYTTRRVILANVRNMRDDAGNPLPVLRYFAYPDDSTTSTTELIATPAIPAADRQRVVRIDVGFQALPTEGAPQRHNSIDITGSVYARAISRENADGLPTVDCDGEAS